MGQPGDRAGIVLPVEPFDRQAGEERRELEAVPAFGGIQLILPSHATPARREEWRQSPQTRSP